VTVRQCPMSASTTHRWTRMHIGTPCPGPCSDASNGLFQQVTVPVGHYETPIMPYSGFHGPMSLGHRPAPGQPLGCSRAFGDLRDVRWPGQPLIGEVVFVPGKPGTATSPHLPFAIDSRRENTSTRHTPTCRTPCQPSRTRDPPHGAVVAARPAGYLPLAMGSAEQTVTGHAAR
jgi:hypothetical protein